MIFFLDNVQYFKNVFKNGRTILTKLFSLKNETFNLILAEEFERIKDDLAKMKVFFLMRSEVTLECILLG